MRLRPKLEMSLGRVWIVTYICLTLKFRQPGKNNVGILSWSGKEWGCEPEVLKVF